LGFNETPERSKNTEDEVNEYLMRAIDARSIDRLRAEHCRSMLLSFRDPVKEAKYASEKDRMLSLYFFCSTFCFVTIFFVQSLAIRWNTSALLCSVPVTILLVSIPVLVYLKNFRFMEIYGRLKAFSTYIHGNRNVAQVFSFLMAISIYILAMLST
ncbi:hypothetical protein HHI36_004531, partial [Cryptolaemus montrouzieri]